MLLAVPAAGQPCPSELTFPRFDFNGDGGISLDDVAVVPLELVNSATNQWIPAATPATATLMTDLQVMASQWDADAPGALGVVASDLDALLYSGDLVLIAAGLAATGAVSATVTVVDHETNQVVNGYDVVVSDPDNAVLTLPAFTNYRLEVEASGPAFTCSHSIGPFSVRAGEDRAVDLECIPQRRRRARCASPGRVG